MAHEHSDRPSHTPSTSGSEPTGWPYCAYAAYRADRGEHRLDPRERASAAEEAEHALQSVDGAHVRGSYLLTGFRAEADLMVWLVAQTPEAIQTALTRWQHTRLGRTLTPWWTNVGVHRGAEFNKGHVPAFIDGEDPQEWVCVYPFVRSYEWYLLRPSERAFLLREHGQLAADYPDVRAHTVSAFALGDYEWLLGFEASELTRIVDLMRELRAAGARRHTREEVPFLTGRRTPMRELVTALP